MNLEGAWGCLMGRQRDWEVAGFNVVLNDGMSSCHSTHSNFFFFFFLNSCKRLGQEGVM